MRARSLVSVVVLAVLAAAAGCRGNDSGAGSATTAIPSTTSGTGAQSTTSGAATTVPATSTTGPTPSTPPASSAPVTSAAGTSTPVTTRPPTTPATTTPSQADAAALAFLGRFDTDQELRTEVLGAIRAALAPGGTADQLTTIPPGLRTASFLVVAGTSGASAGETDAAWKVVQTLAGFWGVQGGFRNDGGQARVGLRAVVNGVTIDTPYDVMIEVADGRFGQAEWVATTHGE